MDFVAPAGCYRKISLSFAPGESETMVMSPRPLTQSLMGWIRGLFQSRRRDPNADEAAAEISTTLVAPADTPLSAENTAEEELAKSLRRTLEARCDVLLRAASPAVRQSDAPQLVERLRALDQAAIHQPPLAAQRALAVARNPRSSSDELAAIFGEDPALTEGLLRAANSNFYRRGEGRCVSIAEGIQGVGVRGIESIVTIRMVEGLLCRPGNAYAPILDQVWAHMTRSAPVARALAPAFGVAAETGFTVGLLHDVGKLVILDYVSRLRVEQRREIRVPESFLLDLLNRLHEPIGGLAALRWTLGPEAAHAIATHHREPPPETPSPLGEVLCVAERADHAVRLGFPLDVDGLWAQAEIAASVDDARAILEGCVGLALMATRERRAG